MTAVTGSVSRGAVIQTATPHGKNNEGLGLTFTVMFKFGGNDPQVLSSCNSENGSSLESSGTFSGELERVTGSTPPNTHTNGKGQTTGLNGKNQSNSSANENNQAASTNECNETTTPNVATTKSRSDVFLTHEGKANRETWLKK